MGSIFSNCFWVKRFSVGENDWKNNRTFLGPKSQNLGYIKLRGSTTSLIESGIELLKTEPLTKKPGIKHKPLLKCLNSQHISRTRIDETSLKGASITTMSKIRSSSRKVRSICKSDLRSGAFLEKQLTGHSNYTDWFIGIRIMAYYTPYIYI